MAIAETGLRCLRQLDSIPAGRPAEIITAGVSVKEWAAKYEVPKK